MGVQNPDNTHHIEYDEVAVEIAFLVTGALVAKRPLVTVQVLEV